MMPEEAPGFRPRHARDPLRLIDMRAMLHREMSAYQDIAVVETREVGRALFLDGVVQSTDHDEARYHAHLIHPVRELVSKRRRVLVAGAGEGASLRELLSDSEIESIVAVEIDRRVVEVCREYFPHWHAGAYDDARVDLALFAQPDVEREEGFDDREHEEVRETPPLVERHHEDVGEVGQRQARAHQVDGDERAATTLYLRVRGADLEQASSPGFSEAPEHEVVVSRALRE